MIRTTTKSLLFGLLTGSLLSFAAVETAHAQKPATPVEQAETFADQAYAAYDKGDYSEAVSLYLKALDAAPSADIIYNVARIYDLKLRDRKLAMTFYRRYIGDPGAEPDRVKVANQRLAALKAAEDAAAIEPKAAPETAPAGESSRDQTRTPPATPSSRGLSGTQTAGIVMGTLGLVGVGVGAGFGLAAMSDADAANDDCDGNACRSQAGVDAANDASDKATISTIAFVAGGTFLVSGVVLLIVGGGSSDTPQADSAALKLRPSVGPTGGNLLLSGSF